MHSRARDRSFALAHSGWLFVGSGLFIGAVGCSPSSNPQGGTLTCNPSELVCEGTSAVDAGSGPYCADVDADPQNCGCCGIRCEAGMACVKGRCAASQTFGFFVIADVHAGPPANDARLQDAFEQMRQIDPKAIGTLSNGDLTESGSAVEWGKHDAVMANVGVVSNFECASAFGSKAGYFASVGDHDVIDPGWQEAWKVHLGVTASASQDQPQALYYSFTYANALFVMLDSEHVSSPQTSYADEQTRWLEAQLTQSTATHKFLFFHRPVYPCNGRHEPFAAGLPWVDLAERYGVRLVFNSHTHVYSRSCPRYGGACAVGTSGTTFVETGAVGGDARELDVTSGTTVGTDAHGLARSDAYVCDALPNPAVSGEPLNPLNDFCHVHVTECQISVDCYRVGDLSGLPFDSWAADVCS